MQRNTPHATAHAVARDPVASDPGWPIALGFVSYGVLLAGALGVSTICLALL
jgi:hypothetical protein